MNLDQKRDVLDYIQMILECSDDQNGYDSEYYEVHELAHQFIEALTKQNNEAILHRNVTRQVKEKYPNATLAQARKAATQAIAEHSTKESN